MGGQIVAKPVQVADPAEAPQGPIDLEHLSRQTLGDASLELEVLRMFDDMSRTYYARLEASTTVPELLRNLHTLKGAAAGVGAVALASLAREAEEELRDGAPVNPERIDDIGMAVEEVSAFIAGRIEAAAAA